MATFVLVHGAFHGAWCWRKLISELAVRGHRALAFDLPGGGDDGTPIAECTLEGNVERIVGVMMAAAEPVVLVGHSLGGVSIAAAAEAAPECVARLVYVAAFMPCDGDSIASLSQLPSARKETGPSTFVRAADGLSFSVDPGLAGERLYNGCPTADIADALPRLRPQAYTVQRAPVHLTEARYGRIPRAYIECLEDNAVSLGLQRGIVARSPCRTISLPTGHSPFFAAPGVLADALEEAITA